MKSEEYNLISLLGENNWLNLTDEFKKKYKTWDKYNYEIIGQIPRTLDDLFEIKLIIVFINEDETYFKLEIPYSPDWNKLLKRVK